MVEQRATTVGEAYGRCFEIAAPESLMANLRAGLPYGWRPSGRTPERSWDLTFEHVSGGANWLISRDSELLYTFANPEDAIRVLSSDLELWVAENADGLVFVHAGAVALGELVLCIPGRSYAGKSTLVAELVRCGADYLSDEFTVLRGDGTVLPYPLPLTLRSEPPGGPLDTRMAPAALEHRIVLVANVAYDSEVGWQVAPMTGAETVLAMLANTVSAKSRPEESLDYLVRGLRDAEGISGTRGDARDAAVDLLARLHG